MELNFKKLNGLLPCVVQDAQTDKVLMLGFMNEEAWQRTQKEKRITFFSRSRQRLWTKGESSGHYLEMINAIADCDGDTLLIKAKPKGPVCHTGADTCFQEKNQV
ncbi:MAG: phosphoribosyl-AMP cyclohydrolase, partial [Bacteroidetes bacterium]|nr:phosphoribosyl-AMP cyclohydrolase [Bacteroidota bacterium]